MEEITHGALLDVPRALGAGMTSVAVETPEGPALRVELGVGMLDETLRAREAAARGVESVLAASRLGRARTRGEGSAYRGDLVGSEVREVALFPIVRAVTLAPALARARAGERAPIAEVMGLLAAIAPGLDAAEAWLTPTSIVIGEERACVRGPLLEAIVLAIRGEREAPRWTSYVAPEQIQGETTTREARRFALGVMLLELASGRALFPAGAAAVTAIAAWQPSPSALEPIDGGAGASELRAVLWSWLQRDPRRRIDPTRAARMLEPFARGMTVTAALGRGAVDAPYFSP
ncbi:MAG: hypothetical protein U0234_23025 [Sandaracinus sp.]